MEAFFEIYSEPAITEFMEGLYPDREQEREYIRQYIEKPLQPTVYPLQIILLQPLRILHAKGKILKVLPLISVVDMEGLYPDREQEREYIRQYIEKIYTFYEFGVWTVVERESGAVIGRAGFSYREGYNEPELGFIIGVPWQHRGYAEEVGRGILALRMYSGRILFVHICSEIFL